MGVQRGSIVSVCAAAYELPTLGVDGSRSLMEHEVMAHQPTRNIQNVSVALYCSDGIPPGFLFQGAASGPQQREETGKGLSCFSLRGPVRHGIVTMEDIIEEIVGEINDEYDEEERTYVKISENVYIFEGKTLLSDFYKLAEINPDDFEAVAGDADTLAGLLLELKGEFPVLHEVINYDRYRFEILEMDVRRIVKVKVTVGMNTSKEKKD